ncbi:MAG: DnaD domain protein [Mycoplasmataceae bacterium]|nr:DnaD domain protein [Mycoplasmataceae bacterium]
MCNLIFSIIKKHDFSIDYKSLYDLYTPIIGSDATNLYINLSNEYDKLLQIGIKFTDANSFLTSLNINDERFLEIRNMLEAIGLIKTYVDQNEPDNYYFELISPLSFEKFIDNQKYRHLLLNKIDQAGYEKLEYLYSNNVIPENLVNISASFEQVFNNQNQLKEIYQFNFERLYSALIADSHQTIILSTKVKQIIESFFSSYNLSTNDIQYCVHQSIVKNDNNEFTVDENLLQLNLKKFVNFSKNVNVFEQAKVNRNSQMFLEQIKEEEIEDVFNSYRNFNSEQYYSIIKKTPLTPEEIEIIQTLRTTYKIDDSLINLMIDYSLLKTRGILNKKYITKMAQTANNLNLLTLVNMYRYLITKHPAPKIKKVEKKPAEFSVGETKVIDFSDVKDSDMPKLPDWFFEK